jgi:hypothetical protein
MHAFNSTNLVHRPLWPLLVERLCFFTLAVFVLLIVASQNNAGFIAPLAFDAGSWPTSVAVGDFNGDGILDLAVATAALTSIIKAR